MSTKDSSFLPSNKEKTEAGVGIFNVERTSDEEEVNNGEEERDDKKK